MTVHVTNLVTKSDASSNELDESDAFQEYYGLTDTGNAPLAPPYDPNVLLSLVRNSNTVGTCIDAYVANIETTGFRIVARDEDQEIDEEHRKQVVSFFEFPDEKTSLLNERAFLRRRFESVGYSFIEVIRHPNREIAVFRGFRSPNVRLVELDTPVTIKKVLPRTPPKEIKKTRPERRYMQILPNGKKRYFAEFGASRDLDKNTGRWAKKGEELSFQRRASQLIHWQQGEGLYGEPRWIRQVPSVKGSRLAEQLNLKYFDKGGIPPVIIFVKGGQLSENTNAKKFREALEGKGPSLEIAVLEFVASEGNIENPGKVELQVERFGAEQMKDSLFEKYLDQCTKRIRGLGFRLTPLFIGFSEDHTQATALASLVVNEDQVFGPERQGFDELINKTLMVELDPSGTLKFVSKPKTFQTLELKIRGLNLIKGRIDLAELIPVVNDLFGFNFEVPEKNTLLDVFDNDGNDDEESSTNDLTPSNQTLTSKLDSTKVDALVEEYQALLHSFKTESFLEDKDAITAQIAELNDDELVEFQAKMAEVIVSPIHAVGTVPNTVGLSSVSAVQEDEEADG